MMRSNHPLKKSMHAFLLFLFGLAVSCAIHTIQTPPDKPVEIVPPGWITTSSSSETDTSVTRAIAERIPGIWMKGNFVALIGQLYSPEIVSHELDKDIIGIEAFKKYVISMRRAYSDRIFKTNQLIINRNKIVWHWTSIGIYNKAPGDALLTGTEIQVAGVTICTVANKKIVEQWTIWDQAAFFTQLSYEVMPPAPVSEK